MAEAGDISEEGEVAGRLEAEVDTQGFRVLEAEVGTLVTRGVREHIWQSKETMRRQRVQR